MPIYLAQSQHVLSDENVIKVCSCGTDENTIETHGLIYNCYSM